MLDLEATPGRLFAHSPLGPWQLFTVTSTFLQAKGERERDGQSVRRTLEAHDTGPIRTGQDTLREGVVEGTRRDNYTAHHTARTRTSIATHHTSVFRRPHRLGDETAQSGKNSSK